VGARAREGKQRRVLRERERGKEEGPEQRRTNLHNSLFPNFLFIFRIKHFITLITPKKTNSKSSRNGLLLFFLSTC